MSSPSSGGKFLGKYRAIVVTNLDPEQRGRLTLQIPDVFGETPSTWAEPCVPLSGPTGPAMGVYLVPPIGAGVWAEFERGDPNYPLWVGCRWGSSSDVPSLAKQGLPTSPNIVLQTLAQNLLAISDSPASPATGGIVLKSATGASIVVNDSGIYIDNGKGASITLVGSTVTVNNGALAVT
jgi:uncharacterized protein involved in type VI secretion and phage assembly